VIPYQILNREVKLSCLQKPIFGVASRSLFPDGPLHQLKKHFSGDGYGIRNCRSQSGEWEFY
jgi:hypothetical protein